MLSGNSVSILTILEKLFRTSGYKKHITLDDAIELAGEAIEIIGVPLSFSNKITNGNREDNNPEPIKITNHKGLLPKDLRQILQTRTFDTKVPLRYATYTFHNSIVCEKSSDRTCESYLTYGVEQGGIIKTSFKEGYLEMAYRAYAVDEFGMPLIPQETRYVLGIMHYIKEGLYRPLWELGKIPDKVFQEVSRERDWYIGSAHNYALLSSMDAFSVIANQMIRLLPDLREDDRFFAAIGNPEIIVRH